VRQADSATDQRRTSAWRRALAGRLGPAAALALTAATVAVAVRWGAFVAGGSDSYCYLAQAGMWLDGSIRRPLSPGFAADWSNGALSLAPTGFIPSPVVPGAIAPICPPGLGLVMAAGQAMAGRPGAFAIVPLAGGLAVWSAFLLGRRLAGAAAGVLAAALTLASPIFLHQLVQPMSDVPAAAFWVAALAFAGAERRGSRVLAGIAVAVAILIRPNLAPLALFPVWLATATGNGRPHRFAVGAGLTVAMGALAGVLAVAAANLLVYGSPLTSGYGDPSHLFAWAHVLPNVGRYATWLVDAQTPWILLALAAPFPAAGSKPVSAGIAASSLRQTAMIGLGFALASVALYLPYVEFEDWQYLRFLLPAVIVLIALAAAVSVRLLRVLFRRFAPAAALLLGASLVWSGVQAARFRHVFELHLSEARYVDTGAWVNGHLPQPAVAISVWQSGSLRLYGRRFTILWDAIVPGEIDTVLRRLDEAGRPPFLVLESWELAPFRERFGSASPIGALDWPPRARIGRDVLVYDPADRARYFAGARVRSERVWSTEELARFRRR
jgi:hypothetical protein